MPEPEGVIDKVGIARARMLIAPHVRATPVINVNVPGCDVPIVLKLEQLQISGSFKARGAFYNLLTREVPAAGVAAASGGNHGAAVAHAATSIGHKATIFVPEISAPAKMAAIRATGAGLVVTGARYADALDACNAFLAKTGAMSIHAYDAPETLTGQGTLADELLEQAGTVDTVLIAVGGGGLIGGCAARLAGECKVIGVEPETCATLHAALAAGAPEQIAPSGVAADSLGASQVGDLMCPIAQSHVDHVCLVTDDDIRSAQVWLWHNLRIVAEPGGATAFAALLSGKYRPAKNEKVAVVICGGNTDPSTFAKLI